MGSLANAEFLDPGRERIPYATAPKLIRQGRKGETEAELKPVLAVDPTNS